MRFKQKVGVGMLVALLVLVGAGVGIVSMLGNHATAVVADEKTAGEVPDTTDESSADTTAASNETYVPTEFRTINGVEYPVNENGLTYGYALDQDMNGTEETHPDLISVIAHNQKHGYCYWDDLQNRNDTTGYTLEQVMAGENNHIIDVYAVDGVTKIGYFGDSRLMIELGLIDNDIPVVETDYGLEPAPQD